MIKIYLFMAMLFIHIIDDFHCQGILGEMKQKSYWDKVCKEYNTDKYKHDYLICLFLHSFEWSFAIMIPIFVYYYLNSISFNLEMIMLIVWNTLVHAVTDTRKCNYLEINLIQDQLTHIVQIIIVILALI